MINLYDFLPESLGPKAPYNPDHMGQFQERKLSWYSDHKAQKKEKETDESVSYTHLTLPTKA